MMVECNIPTDAAYACGSDEFAIHDAVEIKSPKKLRHAQNSTQKRNIDKRVRSLDFQYDTAVSTNSSDRKVFQIRGQMQRECDQPIKLEPFDHFPVPHIPHAQLAFV